MYSVALEQTILPLSMVTPSLLLLWYFHSRDAYPEPASVIWKTFALGVLTVIPVLAFALPLGSYAEGLSSPYLAGLYDAFVLAAFPEEAAKLAVVYWYARRHSEFDEPMDGLVYGVAASLGFATLENILYVADGGLAVALMRALTSIPGHATFGAIMGYFVGQAHFEPGRARRFLVLALALPVLLHGVYDAPLMIAQRAGSADGQLVGFLLMLVPAALIVSIFTALRMSKTLRAEQLAQGPAPQVGSMPMPMPSPMPAQSRGLGLFLVILGGLVATAASLLLMMVLLVLLSGAAAQDEKGPAVVAFFSLIGGLMLIAGILVFRAGTRRANGSASRSS
ncbi:MAG TPA: PrsW family intramembrane metalloprotease [Nannocystis exedens]|nr:PrsW family intramembrane metalloprotease [Nannocystis exedens]